MMTSPLKSIAANHKVKLSQDSKYKSTLTVFKQTSAGLEPFGDLLLPCESENQFDLFKLASYYILAVGQGDCYNTGVFGPLPVLGKNLRCLILTAVVKDSNQSSRKRLIPLQPW